MKSFYILSVATLLLSYSSLAQTPILWSATTGTLCDGATSDVVEQFSWDGDGCIAAEVKAGGETINLFSAERGSVRAAGSMRNAANRTSGNPDEYGFLTVELTGDLTGFRDNSATLIVSFDLGAEGEKNFSINVLPGAESCPIVVPAGTPFTVEALFLSLDEPINNEIGLSYSFTTVDAALLQRVVVPETDFNGSSYQHNLPTGTVSLWAGNRDTLLISLEENKPTAQRIGLIKSEGDIIINGYLRIGVQRATMSGEPHAVQFSLKGVDLCVAGAEVMVEDGASMVLGDTDINYQSRNSCIGTTTNGQLIIAEGTSQQLGEDGYGMQLVREGSVMTVEANASLTFDGILATDFDSGQAFLDVLPGASVVVTDDVITSNVVDQRIVVRLFDDATFDMSDAYPDVKRLFEIEQVSSTDVALSPTAYSVSPNPSINGTVFLRAEQGKPSLKSIDVLDSNGRLLSTNAARLEGLQYKVQLPSVGIYTVRYTDGNGRVGSKRVVRTR